MRVHRFLTLTLICILALLCSVAVYASRNDLASVAGDGTQGNGASGIYGMALSAGGRYVVFSSAATNLVGPLTHQQVFLHDRLLNLTECVSGPNGSPGNDDSMYGVAVSPDGRYVAYASKATNLIDGVGNGHFQIYVKDRNTEINRVVSVTSGGSPALGNNDSLWPTISSDGSIVAFVSTATNLDSRATDGTQQVYVENSNSNTTELISVSPDGTSAGNNTSGLQPPSMSWDGELVAFDSMATNLPPSPPSSSARPMNQNPPPPTPMVLVRNRQQGTTELISVDDQGNPTSGSSPSINSYGRFVAYSTPSGQGIFAQIEVRDRVLGQTNGVTYWNNSGSGNGDSFYPSISPDGRYVTFVSNATNLPGITATGTQVYMLDIVTEKFQLVSFGDNGVLGNTDSNYDKSLAVICPPCVSRGGRVVAFWSNATNLVPTDTNGVTDVFVHRTGKKGFAVGLAVDGTVWYSYKWAPWTQVPGALTSLAIGDLNGDGTDEIAGVASDNTVWYTHNLSTWTNIPGQIRELHSAPMGNDNGADGLAGIAPDNSLWFTQDLSNWISLPGQLSSFVIDNLGSMGNYNPGGLASDGTVWWCDANNNSFIWHNVPGVLSTMSTGDFNGDGQADIVGLAADNSIWYTTDLSTWNEVPGHLVKLVVGDFNGNGKDDLAGLAADGTVWYTTDMATWTQIPGHLSISGTDTFAAEDFSNLGHDSLVGIAGDGSVWYTDDMSTWNNVPGFLSKIYGRRR